MPRLSLSGLLNFQAARDRAGLFRVRFDLLASSGAAVPEGPIRLDLSIENLDGKKSRPVTGVGTRVPGDPMILTAEAPLPEGSYRLFDPASPGREWRFRLDERTRAAVDTFCGHGRRAASTIRRLTAFSPRGSILGGTMRLSIRACCLPAFCRVDPQEPPFYALGITLPAGRPLTTVVEGRSFRIRPGEYLVVNPDQASHHPTRHPAPLEARYVLLHQETLRSFREAAGLPKEWGPFGFDPGTRPASPSLSHAIGLFEEAMARPDAPGAYPAMENACFNILFVLLREHPNRLRRIWRDRAEFFVRDHRLKRAVDYLHAHLDKPYRAQDVARHASVSRELLGRLFRLNLRQSPVEYLQTIRVARAKELLRDRSLSLSRIAERVGYQDVRSFRRIFKAHAGRTTSLYR